MSMKKPITYNIAHAAGADAATARMRGEGRTKWNTEDYQLAVDTFNRLYPDPFAGEVFRLVNRESGLRDQTPPKPNYNLESP